MALKIAESCSHDISDQDVAIQVAGLCPLCLKAERDALVKAASRVIEEWPRASISHQPIIDELVELREVVARVGQVRTP